MKRARWCGTLIAAGVVLFSAGVRAESFSLTGGQILPMGHRGLEVGVGYPGLYGAYHIPLADRFELAPKFSFSYGRDTHAPVVGNGFGMDIKYLILSDGALDLSLLFEPAFVIAYHPGTAVSIILGGPGVLLTYTTQEKFHLVGGLKIPFGFVVHPHFAGVIPILFVMGAEFAVSPTMNLFINSQLGPDIVAGDGGSDAEFSPNFYLGVSMLF